MSAAGFINVGPTVMYRPEFTKDGRSKHSRHCKAAFGRRDWNCHRCHELIRGGSARIGWQRPYFQRERNQRQRSFDW
jgi:hypothetical protein